MLFFEKNAKIVTNLSAGVQDHLKLSFLQGIYELWQKEKLHKKRRRSYQKISPCPYKSGMNGIQTLDQCIERPDI